MLREASYPPGPRRARPPSRGWVGWLALFALFAAVQALAITAHARAPLPAAPGASDKPEKRDPDEEAALDSPRASMARFQAATSGERWAEAALYLELGRADAARGPELARKLSIVLNRRLWLDPELLSPLSAGKKDDRLPAGIDEIGRIVGKDGKTEPVRLARHEARSADDEARWVFSAQTVARVDGLYDALGDRWFDERLPAPLVREGAGPFLYWQLLALPLVGLLSHLAGRPLAWLLVALLGRLARRTPLRWDAEVAQGMRGPARLASAVPPFVLASAHLALHQPATTLVDRSARAVLVIALFWAVLRALTALGGSVLTSDWGVVRPSLQSFSWLTLRVARLTVWTLGGVAVLSQLGYPVGSIVTGLGIGGIALALAAQKTVENLFGSVSILIDQPFRVGDAVRVDGVEGTVERIGLRSTRLRTADRSIVVLANGKLADMRTECLSARDRTRFACKLRLATRTTGAQLGELVRLLEQALSGHPKVHKDDVLVRFTAVGDGCLELDASCTIATTVFAEFATARQELLLACLEATGRARVELASREAPPPVVPV